MRDKIIYEELIDYCLEEMMSLIKESVYDDKEIECIVKERCVKKFNISLEKVDYILENLGE